MQSGKQRYRCSLYGHRFQNKDRKGRLHKKIWHSYAHGKQTYSEIAEKQKKSAKWVRKMIDGYTPPRRAAEPRKTALVIDVIFFGRILGVIVFRSPSLRKNLGWYSITKETPEEYECGIRELQLAGFEISGVTVDGKPGVLQRIERMGIPVQMCHFHQIQIVTRYTTRRPRLPAAKELRSIVRLLPETDRVSFEYWMEEWHVKWETFLAEKTYDEIKQRWRFTHERLRKAYRSIKRHLPYLFTFEAHRQLPNTTNSLDGLFAHVRDKLRFHRGLRWDRKLKLIDELLNGKNT